MSAQKVQQTSSSECYESPEWNKKPIIITTGEPAGIGMDIVLDLAGQGYFAELPQPVIVTACATAMNKRLTAIMPFTQVTEQWQKTPKWNLIQDASEVSDLSSSNNAGNNTNNNADFYLLNVPTAEPVVAGQINVANAAMVLKQLQVAHDLATAGVVIAIVTAPLQKSALIDAHLTLPDGTMFSGHTEYFMQMSGIDGIKDKVVMMLANSQLKVALVTTHLPLSQVAKAITKQAVRQTVSIVLDSLQRQFAIANPKVLVCGLNPHAGEGGHLGMEEIEIINPALQEFIEAGHDISLAMPADTLFTERYLANCDATIAMYHDQGLPVLKSHGFGDSVNITLGLPYVRTSVDHGTALDLAGTAKSSSDSLKQAITYALKMSGH